jgi:long-subunit fatty acid transport protein
MQRCLVALASVLLCLGGWPAAAQTTAQFPVQFDFLNPGARSLAMGSAFVGAADDATAAFTNPAGLAFIARFEVAFEGRYRAMDTTYLSGGRVSGTVSGIGLDTVATPIRAIDADAALTPAFFSVMLPIGARATVTGYRHELTRVENSFFSQGVFRRGSFGGVTDDATRELPIGGHRRVRVTNYGASAGLRLTDRIAVGGGVAVSHLDLDASFERFTLTSDTFSPPDMSLTTATATQESGDVSVGVNVGGLYRLTDRLSIGLTYRRGPSFEFGQEDALPLSGIEVSRSGRFKVPDVIGAGVSWLALDRAAGRLAFLFDVDRVAYSQLKRDFISFQAIASGRAAQLRLDDGSEFHLGGEYQLMQVRGRELGHPWAFRAGVWLDPDHVVRYEATAANDELDALLGATLPGGKDVVHYTFGAGFVASRRVTVNVGADLSSRTKYVTASLVMLFPK